MDPNTTMNDHQLGISLATTEREDEVDHHPESSVEIEEQGRGGGVLTTAEASSSAVDHNRDSDDGGEVATGSIPHNNSETTIVTTNRRRIVDNNNTHNNMNICLTLSASVLLGLVSGSLYGFGRYSRALKDALGISQSQLERFGILLDNGNYIGHPLTGLFYDRMGPKVSCCLAAIIVVVSYGSIHLGLVHNNNILEESDNNTIVWIMNIAFFGVGFGAGLGYIAGLASATKLVSNTKPRFLGRAIGMVASGYGFSSTLVGISYHLVGLQYFFLLWAILVAFGNIIGATIFRTATNDFNHRHNMTRTEENNRQNDDGQGNATEVSDDPNEIRSNLEEPLLPDNSTQISIRSHQPPSPGSRSPRPPAWDSWNRFEFWQLFGAFACITGCGLFVINNISTMVQSIGEQDQLAGGLVVLLSCFNVGGRFFVGVLADSPIDWFGICITKRTLMRYASMLMAIGLLTSATLASPLDDDDDAATSTRRYRRLVLTSTVTMVALAYGACWVLIVGIISDRYGKRHFGKDYGLIALGPALSGYVFNSISAWVYERNANSGDGVCIGNQCYQASFYLTAGAALVGYALLSFMPDAIAATNVNSATN